MPKFPVTVDGKSTEVQEFVDGNESIVVIDDRTYRVRPSNEKRYFMLKIGGTQRSLNGTPEQIREALVRVNNIYREYDRRVRRVKEEAQRARDTALNEIVEQLL